RTFNEADEESLDQLSIQGRAESVVYRLELQLAHRVREAGYAASAQMVVKCAPGMIRVIAQVLPVQKNAAFVSSQFETHAFLRQFLAIEKMLHPGSTIAGGHKLCFVSRECEGIRKGALAEGTAPVRKLLGISGGDANPAMRIGILIVENYQRALVSELIGIGEYVFVDRAEVAVEV